jgi:DNA-binding transcriptional MerR regulator
MSTHALRAWERRYGLIAPSRTAGEARRYSEADLERLALVKRLSEAGFALADTAQLSNEALREVLNRLESYGARSR